MIGKIKYSYIPKSNSLDAILSSLAYAIKATGAYRYKLIDNSSSGIRIYPDEIKGNVIRCSSNDLINTINDLVDEDMELEVILVNGFDISLDELRESYCNIVRYNDILLCVNNIKELENKRNNISIVIDPEIYDLDEDEWEETKEEILVNLDEAKDKSLRKAEKNIFDSKDNDSINSLLKLFGLDALYDEDKKGYVLSPAYDLTKTLNKLEHEMTVNGNANPTKEDLLNIGKQINLSIKLCNEIIEKILNVIR